MTNTVNTENLSRFSEWEGRTEICCDRITETPTRALRATLDLPASLENATELPLLWHWLYFSSPARAADIDTDGHPKRGGFLPPIPLPRRMWAGGRLEVKRPLTIGEDCTRKSTIKAVTVKEGRGGTLVFVTLLHEISDRQGLALIEEQDLVYRDAPPPGSVAATKLTPHGEVGAHSRQVTPDPVFLFRYSALTFNSHRIHYDRDYATGAEGYPGLVVHGPLIATLLLDLLNRKLPEARVRHFSFKAVSPLFDTHPFSLHIKEDSDGEIKLWALNHIGSLAMSAGVRLA